MEMAAYLFDSGNTAAGVLHPATAASGLDLQRALLQHLNNNAGSNSNALTQSDLAFTNATVGTSPTISLSLGGNTGLTPALCYLSAIPQMTLSPVTAAAQQAGINLAALTLPLKRGPEELRLYSTNGELCPSSAAYELAQETKKVKLDSWVSPSSGGTPPLLTTVPQNQHQHQHQNQQQLSISNETNRTILIRNLPTTCNELDVVLMGVPFGRMKKLILSKKTGQALLEMERSESATELVQYYSSYPAQLQGQSLWVQLAHESTVKVLLTNEGEQNSSGESAAIETGNQLVAGSGRMEPRSVLHVIVENVMGHNINHLTICKIFQNYSKVLRTIMFTKNSVVQCLVELESPQAAYVAKLSLNGQNIYTGCCTLRIEFSKNNSLEVRSENDKCRDFLRTPLTEVEKCALNGSAYVPPVSSCWAPFTLAPSQPQQQLFTVPFTSSSLAAAVAQQQAATVAALTDLSSSHTVASLASLTPAAFMGAQDPFSFGLTSSLSSAALNNATAAAHAQAAAVAAAAGLPSPSPNSGGATLVHFVPAATLRQLPAGANSILLVSNLNEQKINPDHLFILFGVYGDVQRVKIMYNKKDNALIQFTDAVQAHTALENLKGVILWDKPMKITFSRHAQIQMPKEETDIGLTKDYSSSHLHRFKKPNSKNYHNIFPPSTTLHLSNMPISMTQEALREIIESKGYTIVNFKFLLKEKKMALIELPSIQDAVQALIDLHNWQVSESCHLRISFSKAVINS